MNEGLINLKVLNKKEAQQESLLAFGKETGNMAYQEAYQSIKDIVAKRFQAVYHQQAIYEALMLGTEFSKIPDTAPLLKALKEKDKKLQLKQLKTLQKREINSSIRIIAQRSTVKYRNS